MSTKPEWERLSEALERDCNMNWPDDYDTQMNAATELSRLGQENEALASWQCIYTDGSGLTGDEGGSQVCMKDAELRRLNDELDKAKTKLRSRSEQIKAITHLVTQLHQAKGRYHTQLATCALFDAFGLSNTKPERKVK